MAAFGSGQGKDSFDSLCEDIPFSDDQISVMKEIFEQCPNPFPSLCNREDGQLKSWSENQRNFMPKEKDSDEKERRERLTATNSFFKEEKCKLKNQVNELQAQNEFLRKQLMTGS